MKKLLSILLALLMVFALVGCTPKQEETPAEGGETTEVAEEGKVFHIYAWNEEFKGFFEKYYKVPEGIEVVWTIVPNEGTQYQDALDLALTNQDSADPDDKVDMFLAEAVVPRAAGAVPELQLRVIHVRPPAHGALVAVALAGLLLLLLLGGGAEVDGLRLAFGPHPLAGEPLGDLGPEEHEEVQKGNDGEQGPQKVQPQQAQQDRQGEEGRVEPRKPLHLHRDDEEDEELGLREQGGKGEKHGEVDVPRAGDPHVLPRDEGGEDAGEQGQKNAGEVVEIELGGAPLPLQRGADHVVEIQ